MNNETVAAANPRGAAMPAKAYWGAVLLVLALVYSAWYPGVFTLDELDILRQAAGGIAHDGHSPLLISLWSLATSIHSGSALPYSVALFGTGLFAAAVLRMFFHAALAWILLVGFLLLPAVFTAFGLVTKDLFFAGAMVAVVYCFLRFLQRRSGWWCAFALVAMQLAVMIRIDAVFAIAPGLLFCLFAVLPARLRPALLRLTAALICCAVLVVVLMANTRLANRFVFHAKPYHAEQVSMLFDLSAISIQLNRQLLPTDRQSNGNVPVEVLRSRISPASADSLIWSPDQYHLVYQTDADHDALARAWARAIGAHPAEYLRHRGEYLARYVGIRNDSPWLRGHFQGDESMVDKYPTDGWNRVDSPVVRLFERLIQTTPAGIITLPWAWLLLGLLAWQVLAWGWPNTPDDAALCAGMLVGSALTHTFLMGLVSAAALARYHTWPRIAIGLAVALAIGSLLTRAKPAPAGGVNASKLSGQ
ncbi:hypothetical protein JJQ59_14605 [Cupriavidus necator]|uniref:Glycosyltransferase RgtA/B/C/D-like domain-containing protein n=1 Tax=Cupriavidus necator TaxID=106590 RepID=A0A367PGU1_CUPNE|nr:hypothetical protein [Cupriavidus necator]QQX83635.1 hypothetical protein JJQ59_14605 [Cupriavidus necator]RCJ06764.1 hypothetical protein DDK22_20000 [Cupriavidus necator]